MMEQSAPRGSQDTRGQASDDLVIG